MDIGSDTMEVPNLHIPISLFMQCVVSFHLQMICYASNRDEAIFHWRQIRYYRDYANSIAGTEGLEPMMDEREVHRKMKASGHAPLIIEAIEKYNLLEVE